MPIVVTELVHRHQQTMDLKRDGERTFLKLIRSEKLASLGQMAAGIAHELNNAVAVVDRNTAWLEQAVSDLIATQGASCHCDSCTGMIIS